MSSSTVILDYEPPPPRLMVRAARRVAALARAVWLRRPWLAELLVLAWLTLCAANVMQALRSEYPRVYRPPLYSWGWPPYALAVVVGASWGLLRERRWRAIGLCAGIVLVTGVASGALQLSSCPHATYLQFAGLYVPVWGDPCNNTQNYYLQPWWML